MLERHLKLRTGKAIYESPAARITKWAILFNDPATKMLIGKNDFVMMNVYIDKETKYVGFRVVSGEDVDAHSFILRKLRGHTSKNACRSIMRAIDEIIPLSKVHNHFFPVFKENDMIGFYLIK